jgi:2,5-diketo-D-gluconate reductase A
MAERHCRTRRRSIFDFSLSTEDVAAISGLDRGDAAGADSDAFGH